MDLPVALALLFLIPAVISLVQEGKDHVVKSLCGLLIVLGLLVVLRGPVDLIGELIDATWMMVIAVIAAVAGMVLVVRLKNRVCGTCIACGSGLMALIAIDVIGS